MNFFTNLDLLAVGVVVAAIGILGIVVFLNNTRSVTNRTFLFFSILTIAYGIVNYVNYQVTTPYVVLLLLRFTLFFAVWHAFCFFQLFYVFPKEHVSFSRFFRVALLPIVIITSFLTLTPFVFSRVQEVAAVGQVTNPERGPAIALFGAVVVCLVVGGLVLLTRKVWKATGIEKIQLRYMFIGAGVTFSLIILFNFILPVIFNNLRFIPLAPLYIFPFIIFTSYAILKHHLLNVKVIATEILTFLVVVITFFEIIISRSIGERIFRSVIFVTLLFFGALLIRGVRREVEQRETLARLAKKLSDFISFATHELRNPITAFKGAISMILEGNFGEILKDSSRMLRKVYLEAEEMGETVETFLNINKIEIGSFTLTAEEQDLVEVITSAVEQAKYRADEKKIDLKFIQPTQGLPKVYFDRFKIKHAVTNLLTNAIKYNNEGGKVRVTVEQKDGEVIVKVTDTGIGIAADILPKLFNQYQRGSEKAQKFAEGSGIGLWLTKQIIDLHKGRVWAESKGAGFGSTFFISLPVLSPALS